MKQIIKMTFGIDKCKVDNIKHAKREIKDHELKDGKLNKSLDATRTEEHKIMNVKLRRTKQILKAELNFKSTFEVLNTHAIQILIYRFGTVTWIETELEEATGTNSVLLTKHDEQSPKATTERIRHPRRKEGRGLRDIKELHDCQIKNLRKYFETNTEIQATTRHSKHYGSNE